MTTEKNAAARDSREDAAGAAVSAGGGQEESPPWAAGTAQRMHELNPELTEAQIDIVRRYGEEQTFDDGEILWDIGEENARFHLTLEGAVEIVRRDREGEHVIISHQRGHYGGETVTMTGRGPLVFGRARGQTKTVAVRPESLRELIATETGVGEIILQSFILRRMRMVAEHHGDIVLIGSDAFPGTGATRTFLSRNGIPHTFAEYPSPQHASVLDDFGLSPDSLPALICDGSALCRPTPREIAERLGFAARIGDGETYDVAIVGAGAGGLAAATYAASEGLSVLVIEACAPGGQAATSSKIENYLGFPTGISGQALMGRGWLQSQKFGAILAVARAVEALECGTPHHLRLDGDTSIFAKAVVLASGAIYREPPIEGIAPFLGSNVHYAATYLEGRICSQREVAVVGGGNSAGQAAMFLSEHARKVAILVRGPGLEHSMSSYLIERIQQTPNIELMTHTEVQSARGDQKLESVTLLDNRTGDQRDLELQHLFIFIGAQPATSFLPEDIQLDSRGFVKTGNDLDLESLTEAWPLKRQPYLLETSCPGVFAVGDVRSGSVKRVASAVGEGSVSVQFVHRFLSEPREARDG
ncbi:MAG: FAD-dependent oxidoreductase [Acidobacteriota bacterium]